MEVVEAMRANRSGEEWVGVGAGGMEKEKREYKKKLLR